MIMRLTIALLLPLMLYGQEIKVYFYTTETSVNNFKTLKISFDNYLGRFGSYEFQPFHDKRTFEEHLSDENAVVILSSWHYETSCRQHNLEAVLVAQKDGRIQDSKVLIGKQGSSLNGVITSAYDREHTQALLKEIFSAGHENLNVLTVPKEIDALMSVGFGMSKLALVSKDSFEHLKTVNPAMARSMKVLNTSTMAYRMFMAKRTTDNDRQNIISVFENMHLSEEGRKQLSLLGIDKMVAIPSRELSLTRGVE